jgi:hypothetical protein
MALRLPAALAVVAALTLGAAGHARDSLVLGTSAGRFTVNGSPGFLVFASYFDALDAPALQSDLDYLAGHVDGVRVFATWWDFADTPACRLRFDDDALIGVAADGAVKVRPDRLARLKAVLDTARTHGLLVDLSFAAETVRGLSRLTAREDGGVCPPGSFRNQVRWRAYAPAVAEVAAALRSPEYRHVLFDLQNEAGHRLNGATPDDLAVLVSAVRAADPARLLAVSMFDPDADRQARLVDRLGLACLDFHDWPRGRGWGERTAGQVRKFRDALAATGLTVPVYAGEPDAGDYGRGTAEFAASLAGARRAGAAAWTFHTRAAHDLGGRRLVDVLGGPARTFLDGLDREGPGSTAPFPALGVN